VHGLRERPRAARTVVDEVDEQVVRGPLHRVRVLSLVLHLLALDQPHQPNELAADLVGDDELVVERHGWAP
jgi:hypothetical protein